MIVHSRPTPHENVSFGEEAMAEFRDIVSRYPERRAALMATLWLAQREFGWISETVEAYVAELLELPIAWVEGVVTFYSMYYKRPMGRHHLQVCTNVSCRLRGAEEVLAAIERKLGIRPGQTTADGSFSLDCVECLAACEGAPVVQAGEEYVENLDVDQALQLVDRLASGKES